MSNLFRQKYLPVFFGVAAASWMPHLSCHYYKLETGSTFIVGNLSFSDAGSILAMLVYLSLVVMNLTAIARPRLRFPAALADGVLHISLGMIHIFRFIVPFDFEVFGYEWSIGSSVREVLMIFPLGVLCIAVALKVNRIAASHEKIVT